MKKEPPSVFETIIWALLTALLVWFLTVGFRRNDNDDICDKIRRLDSETEILECDMVNYKEMT